MMGQEVIGLMQLGSKLKGKASYALYILPDPSCTAQFC